MNLDDGGIVASRGQPPVCAQCGSLPGWRDRSLQGECDLDGKTREWTCPKRGHANTVERYIRDDIRSPIAIPDLARRVGMSSSAFHKHFKTITSTTPLNYQKELRLLEARQLLRTGSASVTTVAYEVGYESASQFSREYSRKFGVPPSQDVARAIG